MNKKQKYLLFIVTVVVAVIQGVNYTEVLDLLMKQEECSFQITAIKLSVKVVTFVQIVYVLKSIRVFFYWGKKE